MLQRRGGVECDLTVTRLAPRRFLLVTGTAFGNHDLGWIRAPRARPTARASTVSDVTSGVGVLRRCGARGRATSSRRSPTDDLSNDAFPVPDGAPDHDRPVPVLALRVTYVGELGWELYCPTEYGLGAVGRALGRRASAHGIVAGGYRAIDALRLEKGYRVWGDDITPDDTPYEAGLGFAVAARQGRRLHRPRRARRGEGGGSAQAPALPRPRRPALGRARQRAGPGRRRDRRPGDERWLRFRVERSIAYAYLPPDQAAIGTRGEVEVFGDVGRLRDRARAAVRPDRRADPVVSGVAPGDSTPFGPVFSASCARARAATSGSGWRSPSRRATRPTRWRSTTSGGTSTS